ncbi:MAG TPA: hypothetical protein DEB39_12085, partial [Planctomycetaceae bacterium]|nr:hypothetical protein [Planctomycetaceae bacterium]
MANLYKKTIIVADKQTGEKIKTLSKKWYARYIDADGIQRRVALAADKKVAQKMLADLLQKTDRGVTTDPFAEAVKIPVRVHLDEFEQHLISKNNTTEHVSQTIRQIDLYLERMRPRTIGQIDVASVEKFLTGERKKKNISLGTCNHYIRAIKSFCNWLVKSDRLARHPLMALSLYNADTDPRHARRSLEPQEFEYMLKAAEESGSIEGLVGKDRRMFYILAAWTGFRKGELGSVTLRHFKLDGEFPMLTIRASYSKRKREDTQFLHPDVVAEFNAWVDEKNPGPDEILFPVSDKTCPFERKTSVMVERDLASAREVWINEANSDAERAARESSDFLKYVDSHGKYADFHGLRHT